MGPAPTSGSGVALVTNPALTQALGQILVNIHDSDTITSTPAARGLLANYRLNGQAMRATYFFAGNWRNDWSKVFYEGKRLAPNDATYSIFPHDAANLGWSESEANRKFALDQMQAAGINTVVMSSWGRRGEDRWAFWAPMHTAPEAHDELFDEIVSRNRTMYVMPAIESGSCTQGRAMGWVKDPLSWWGTSWSFNFASEFPWFHADPNGSPSHPSAALVAQVEDLVDRYILHPKNPLWPTRWARLYDNSGWPRYAINLIHVASNQLPAGQDHVFARTFDDVALRVWRDTGVWVGFTLDVVPTPTVSDQNCGGQDSDSAKWTDTFNASPEETGPHLLNTSAVLAIQSFIPEIWSYHGDERALRQWKRDFFGRWVASGVPVMLDVDPGYDNHLVFPDSPARWGYNDDWFNFQSDSKSEAVRGIVVNTWNGYTEGYAGVPLAAPGGGTDSRAFAWIQNLLRVDPRTCDYVHTSQGRPSFQVYGANCEKWKQLGGLDGALGAPISSEYAVTCKSGAKETDFVHGSVVWTPLHGAHETHGDIAQLWRHMGGSCGTAGIPLSDEYGPPNARATDFEHGSIHWVPGGGAWWVPKAGNVHF